MNNLEDCEQNGKNMNNMSRKKYIDKSLGHVQELFLHYINYVGMKAVSRTISVLAVIMAAVTISLLAVSCKRPKYRSVKVSENECWDDEVTTLGAVAQTNFGKVAGYVEKGIFEFKGIPYAEADRFLPPHNPAPWHGERSSRAYGPVCPQSVRTGWASDTQAFAFEWDDGYQDEDCLRLNIWTPGLNDGKGRPVMIWIHGGGFAAGSSQELPAYDGANLSRRGDVVVVSINHRLNVLGFLDLSAFGDKYAKTGNLGMLDIVAALKWVKDNIASFGGDPSNVTIFGQSGGGGKVTTLMSMPSAKGLFQKAIVESGSLTIEMESKYSRRIGVETLKELGLSSSQIDKIQTIPYANLLAAGNKAVETVRKMAVAEGFEPFLFGWGPTVDGDVLPAQPLDKSSLLLSKDVPMIVGTNFNEFNVWSADSSVLSGNSGAIRKALKDRYGNRADTFFTTFFKVYPNARPVDCLMADMLFRPLAIAQADSKSALEGAPVYMYLFVWESPVLDGSLHSVHCMELPFVFDNIARANTMTGGGRSAFELAAKMSSAWINFARFGDPNGNAQSTVEGLPKWKPYEAKDGATMFFGDKCEIRFNPDRELMSIIASGNDSL